MRRRMKGAWSEKQADLNSWRWVDPGMVGLLNKLQDFKQGGGIL